MKRKLILLNLLLLAAAAAAGWRLRKEWVAAHEREQALAKRPVKPLPPPMYAPPEGAQPVQPSGYIDIAQKMLFSKDRNPVVTVETPAPPPPKPMPPLPILYGVMNIDGPSAIVAAKPDAPHQELRPGETIGEFTLIAVDTRHIVLEWDGKRIERKLDEIVHRASAGGSEEGSARPAAATPAPAPKPPPPARAEPGVDIGRGVRACLAGDTSPPGTVSQGMRKVVTDSPFGQVCRWEPTQR